MFAATGKEKFQAVLGEPTGWSVASVAVELERKPGLQALAAPPEQVPRPEPPVGASDCWARELEQSFARE